jgi:hypothetical protein
MTKEQKEVLSKLIDFADENYAYFKRLCSHKDLPKLLDQLKEYADKIENESSCLS